MRLIDADALKEELELSKYIIPNDLNRLLNSEINRCIEAIDNAPTIDLKDIYQEGHYDGHLEGYTKAINEERPQGEWITRHKLNSFGQDVVCFECNKCGEYKVPLYHLFITEPLKVCPNCGADMRGDKE